ncbi:Dbl homology domain-containing protein [Mortierella sp. GBAus27b]|nr:Dbl homology domain-containing protein [Mortierella sp. GBAus27b]
MKVSAARPFVAMDTDTVMQTDQFPTFRNDNQENTSPRAAKVVDLYDAVLVDRNVSEDPMKHSNGIQSQQRTFLPSFGRGNKPVHDAQRPATPSITMIAAPPHLMSTRPSTPSAPKVAIATMNNGACKPLWQHTMTNAEQISALGLSQQEIRRQETIFELIYTESEYLDDLKSIHKIFVEELNVKMAESRRKKRFSPDKSDVKLNERLARLLSHIKDLWNGHQSLLRSLQNKQQHGSPVVRDIGSVFESFYMFSIYDSYFAQYTTTSRDFQYIANGNSELCLIMKDLLKSPSCKCLSLEGIFLKPIQRLQKYPLFFKDLMNMTPTSDPDYAQLEQALNNHQRELTKIDDRIWIEEHNEMLTDLQQRIKGLPSNFSLVERHRYLILDGPVHRITFSNIQIQEFCRCTGREP